MSATCWKGLYVSSLAVLTYLKQRTTQAAQIHTKANAILDQFKANFEAALF